MQTSIERYQSLTNTFCIHNYGLEHNLQKLKFEVADNKKKICALEVLRGRLMGEGLNECSMEELKLLQKQLELSITNIRDRKDHVFTETINQLNKRMSSFEHFPYDVMAHNIDFPPCYNQEKNLIAEQVTLREKCVGQMEQPMELSEIVPYRQSSEDSCEVETELFIGWPPSRRANPLPLQTR